MVLEECIGDANSVMEILNEFLASNDGVPDDDGAKLYLVAYIEIEERLALFKSDVAVRYHHHDNKGIVPVKAAFKYSIASSVHLQTKG
jgi:hypothetical protein